MNFLTLCQKVDVMSGIQGMIQNVQNIVGAQEVIVEAVRQGFLDLQNERMTWEFMRRTKRFSMAVGKSDYSVNDVFGIQDPNPAPGTAYDVFARWQRKHPGISYKLTHPVTSGRTRLWFSDFRDFREQFSDVSQTGRPHVVTANEQTQELMFNCTPDLPYLVDADYFVEPQTLIENADIPILPSRFHLLLVYLGLERVGNHYSNPGLYQRYAIAAARMTGDLYRDQVPAESVIIRAVA